MKYYFELTDKNGMCCGVVENVPTELTIEQVKDRIETKSDTEQIIIVNNICECPDIILDWNQIDLDIKCEE